ncbi:hypothetical protein ACIBG4_31865 [Nonomuraea sp. NPDC050383]|uniref:hypothetical protein n=1 Tax=Nonomuraea sp. NPDC050383 TaxID=3364362 RepID=UPI0037957B36
MAKSELLLIRDASRIPEDGPVAAPREQIKAWLESTSPGEVTKAGQTFADAEQAVRKAAEELPKIAKRLAAEWGGETSPHVQKALQMLNATGLELASAMGLMSTSLSLYGNEYLPQARQKIAAIPAEKPAGTEENTGGGTTGIPRSETGEDRDPDKEAQKVLQDLNKRIVDLWAMYIPQHVFYEVPEVDIPSDTGGPKQGPDLTITPFGAGLGGSSGGGGSYSGGGFDGGGTSAGHDGSGGPGATVGGSPDARDPGGSADARDPQNPGTGQDGQNPGNGQDSPNGQDGSQPGDRGDGTDGTPGTDTPGTGQDQQSSGRDGQGDARGDRETTPAVIGKDPDPRSTDSASYFPQHQPLTAISTPITTPITTPTTQYSPNLLVGGQPQALQPGYGVPSVLGGPQYGAAASASSAVPRGTGSGMGMIPPVLGGGGADGGGEEYTTDLREDRNPFAVQLDVTTPTVGERA